MHLSASAATTLLEVLPGNIRSAIEAYAEAMEYPIEAVVEMAIASFLDEDAVNFQDCRPLAAMGMARQVG
jgi:hypothetical protein